MKSDYKEEVFLIKGHYYTLSSQHRFPLYDYGVVESSLAFDASDFLHFSDCFSNDVLILRHEGMWGLFPRVAIHGMGVAVWASVDEKPFIYEDYKVTEDYMGGKTLKDYGLIFLKKDGKWGMITVPRSDDMDIKIIESIPFESESLETILNKASQMQGVTIVLKDRFTCVDEPCRTFDESVDFITTKGRPITNTDVLFELAMGIAELKVCRETVFAAARRNPYALALIGRQLYDEVIEAGDSCEDDPSRLSFSKDNDLVLKLTRSREYFELALTIAKEKGDVDLENGVLDCLGCIANILRNQNDLSYYFAEAFYARGRSFKDKSGRRMSPAEFAYSLDRHTLYEIDGVWYTYDSIFFMGRMEEDYKERYKENSMQADKLTFYMLNDCNVSGLCIVENNGKYGIFPLKERTGQQSGVWCCEGEPFLYEAVSVYADWQRWDDYGYVAAKKDGKWGAFKITQFPEPSSELVVDFVHPGPDEAILATGEKHIPDKEPFSQEV